MIHVLLFVMNSFAATPGDFVVASYVQCVKQAKNNEVQRLACARQFSTIQSYKNIHEKSKAWQDPHRTLEPVICDKSLLKKLGLSSSIGKSICYTLHTANEPSRKLFFTIQGNRISSLKIL